MNIMNAFRLLASTAERAPIISGSLLARAEEATQEEDAILK